MEVSAEEETIAFSTIEALVSLHLTPLCSMIMIMLDARKDAVSAIGRGEVVVVMDDESRENEGDLVSAAEHTTARQALNHVHLSQNWQTCRIPRMRTVRTLFQTR